MKKATELNVGRAIAYTEERRRQREFDRQLAEVPAMSMADGIAGGLCGLALSKTLHAHFPNARRADVYLAIGVAVAWLQAELTIARMELDLLRQAGTTA